MNVGNLKVQTGLLLIVLTFIVSCSSVPVTGRKQLKLVPSSSMLSMSFQQYDEFIKTNDISNNSEAADLVMRVGTKIQHAVEKYFAENKLTEKLDGYNWEFNLVESPEFNAWCMPGGKVVVYTGILSVTEDETGLAVVMGHEIAHAVAEHGRERMSQELIVKAGNTALTTVLRDKPDNAKKIWASVIGMGTKFGVMLPFSRRHETEADHIGLIFMSMAGYDPNKAVDFWQRMSQSGEGKAPRQFLSTHPSDETRIKNIKKEIPEAMKYYNPNAVN